MRMSESLSIAAYKSIRYVLCIVLSDQTGTHLLRLIPLFLLGLDAECVWTQNVCMCVLNEIEVIGH